LESNKPKREKTKLDPSIIFVGLALLFGGYVRLSVVLGASAPLNDGGLFYTMTNDLIANHFKIPLTTTYNHLNIPFAYPPLQFYIAGLMTTFLHWNLLDIFRLLPAVISTLSILAFFFLAKDMLKNDTHAGMATLIFSLIPAAFDWPIMGGGITRSPAFFFALLTLLCVYRLYTKQEKRYILLTALFAALTVLSHPETALHTAASTLVFFLFFGRNKRGVIRSAIVAGLVLLFTSPWWFTVLSSHGLAPFLAAGGTGWHNLASLVKIFLLNQFSEYQLTPITVLAFIGLLLFIASRNFFFPVWFAVIFLSEPRSAPLFLTPVISIFAAYSLIYILNLLNTAEGKKSSESDTDLIFSSISAKILFAILFAQWCFSAFSTATMLSQSEILKQSEKNAFSWAKQNSPQSSKFLILSGSYPLSDPVSEWFPALSDRISVGTAQGHEWLSTKNFNDVLEESAALQECYTHSPACFNDWLVANNESIDYILIVNHLLEQSAAQETTVYPSALIELLRQDPGFAVVYDADGVVIFRAANE
jgi:hypothetical protein